MGGIFLRDFRQAARSAGRSPGFTALAAMTLALGVAGNAIVLATVYGLLVRPLPFPHSDRLLDVSESNLQRGGGAFGVSPASLRDWRAGAPSIERMAAFLHKEGTIAVSGRPERVDYALASSELFATLGVAPAVGRAFSAEEDTPGRQDAVVVSDALWRRAFGPGASFSGQTLLLDGKSCRIVGVMPPGFDFPGFATALWRPFGFDSAALTNREAKWVEVVARLKPGATPETAQRELSAVAARIARAEPQTNAGWGVLVRPLRERFVSGLRPALRVFSLAVALVFSLACANVAALLLTRATARRKEFAIRIAIGASSAQISRQVLAESMILASAGGILGFVLASWAFALLRPVMGSRLAGFQEMSQGWLLPVLCFGLSALAGFLASIVPALRMSRGWAAGGLGQERSAAGAGNSSGGFSQTALVVAEIAFAVVLLAGTATLARSFHNLMLVQPGFDANRLISLRIAPPWRFDPQQGHVVESYIADRDRIAREYDRLLHEWETFPGVVAAGAVNRPPLGGNWWTTKVRVEASPIPPAGQEPVAQARVATPGYFRAARIPLLAGRALTDRDVEGAPPVVVVSRVLAARLWPGQDPIGRRMSIPDLPPPHNQWLTVAGVAGDVRYQSVAADPTPVFYLPLRQTIQGFFGDWGMTFLVRAAGDPRLLLSPLRESIRRTGADVSIEEAAIVEDRVRASLETPRLSMLAFGVFGGLSLLLCGVGVYGVVSQATARRTGEIGIRVALGARPRDVLGLILRQGAGLAALGAGVGLAASVALLPLMAGFLYGVPPAEPAALAATVGIVGGVALLGTWIPARRASRLEPMKTIRQA